jgi:hypothetical protein
MDPAPIHDGSAETLPADIDPISAAELCLLEAEYLRIQVTTWATPPTEEPASGCDGFATDLSEFAR